MKKAWRWCAAKVQEWFSLDYRSLAVLRMAVGITIIFDLIQRAEDLRAFYSDAGVLPRETLLQLWNTPLGISIHLASGMASFEAVLFIIAGVFALMLVFGYRTQLAMIVSWFLVISIQIRNPMILQGGDVIFRVVLFWMMFLPLGRAWSLDRLFNRVPRPTKKTVLSVATIAYIVQISLVYIFSGVLKTGTAWQNGTAVYYALHVSQLITPTGALLSEFPRLMTVLSYSVLYLEKFGTILFFSPVATEFFRMLGIVLFALMQIGFNASMRLGLFGTIMVAITLGLIPTGFWDSAWKKFCEWWKKRAKKGLSIYYDFDCTFCYKISFLLKRTLLLNEATRVLPASADPLVETIMNEQNSWVIVDREGNKFTGWDGVRTVVYYSPFLGWAEPILGIGIFRRWGDQLYREIAKKRKQVCMPEREPPLTRNVRALNILLTVTLFMLTIYIVLWNVDSIGAGAPIINPALQNIAYFLHLDQKFNMFAPTPLTQDGWYVMPGTLRDGTSVDVFTGNSPVSYAQPKWVAYTYKNQRWQKYMMNFWDKSFSDYRLPYAQYLCRQWNSSHPYDKQLLTFNIIFMEKRYSAAGTTSDTYCTSDNMATPLLLENTEKI